MRINQTTQKSFHAGRYQTRSSSYNLLTFTQSVSHYSKKVYFSFLLLLVIKSTSRSDANKDFFPKRLTAFPHQRCDGCVNQRRCVKNSHPNRVALSLARSLWYSGRASNTMKETTLFVPMNNEYVVSTMIGMKYR